MAEKQEEAQSPSQREITGVQEFATYEEQRRRSNIKRDAWNGRKRKGGGRGGQRGSGYKCEVGKESPERLAVIASKVDEMQA